MSSAPSSLTLAALLPAGLSVDASRMQLGAGNHGDEGGFLRSKIGEGVTAALKLDVMELIAEAWAKTDELRGAAAGAGSGSPAHLFLAGHDVSCDSELKVVLEFAGMPALTDHLKLRLKAMFQGVGVTVANGCIVALDAGRGAAKAELLYSNTSLLSESSDWVTLPGQYTLARPVRIGHA
ncbi:hypothetical protein [Roseateles sp.]|uniref:hypothetical protein n=1 Tax=Roseateles sp. TaxID=1971397 RepID=UPI0025FB8A01|nr:hypothetical protein [Roseateles sp.]MBV8036419.1 hypothetical protein [Roseateles sp.]